MSMRRALRYKDVAELLLANKANVNAEANDKSGGSYWSSPRNWTPLHYAAGAGHRDVAELLLANKADVNPSANYNWTPLHEAATNGHRDVVELLLANGAEVNAISSNGRTPFHLAQPHKDVAELLRQHGGKETP